MFAIGDPGGPGGVTPPQGPTVDAVNDNPRTVRGKDVIIDVAANDRAFGHYGDDQPAVKDPRSVKIVVPPLDGHVAEVLPDGRVLFRPNPAVEPAPDRPVTVNFDYQIWDVRGYDSDVAHVHVAIGVGLLAVDDHVVMSAGETRDVNVMGNDNSAPGTRVQLVSVRGPDVQILPGGSLRLTARPGDVPDRTIQYRLRDDLGCESIGNLTVAVEPTTPVAVRTVNDGSRDQPLNAVMNASIGIRVLDNDQGTAPLAIARFDSASLRGGRVVSAPGGELIYTPPTNLNGIDDAFTYQAVDAAGRTSDPATVYLKVNGARILPTALGETDDTYDFKFVDWNRDGFTDLVAIKKSRTGSGHTELHVLSGDPGPYRPGTAFQSFLLQASTWFLETGPEWEFDVADWDGDGGYDLIGYMKTGSPNGHVDFVVTTASTNFQGWVAGGTLPLLSDPTLTLEFADWGPRGNDIIAIKKGGTGSGRTEVHVVSGASGFRQFVLHAPTALPETGAPGYDFQALDWNGDGVVDLAMISQQKTGSHSAELHVLDGRNFTSFLVHQGSGLPEDDGTFSYAVTSQRDGGIVAVRSRLTQSGMTEVWAPEPPRQPSGASMRSLFEFGGVYHAAAESIVPLNGAPVANADRASTDRRSPVVIDPLANDSDPDGDALVVVSVSPPAHGAVAITGGGRLVYTPDPAFSGTDHFEYTLSDQGAARASAQVEVQVRNAAPWPQGDSVATGFGAAALVDVVANDLDADADPLTLTGVVRAPAHGSAALTASGQVLYTPSFGFAGEDSFSYAVADGIGGTAVGEVIIDVRPPAAVVGRYAFYNDTASDGNDVAANAADDAAIAPGRRALLPGRSASDANVTPYVDGLNAIMIDVANLPQGTESVNAGDFVFRADPGLGGWAWKEYGVRPVVTVRPGAGVGGSDRLTLLWGKGAIRNGWLRVSMRANARTGLTTPDVFYFGNLVGDNGGNASAVSVKADDLARVRSHQLSTNPADLQRYDFNRDGRINATDLAICRSNQLRSLQLFTAPTIMVVQSAAPNVAQGLRTTPFSEEAVQGFRREEYADAGPGAADVLT